MSDEPIQEGNILYTLETVSTILKIKGSGFEHAKTIHAVNVDNYKELCEEQGFPPEEIKLFEGDCWHYPHKILFGAVIKQLNKTLADLWGRSQRKTYV